MRLRTKTTELVEKAVPLQHALTLITRDLQGIMASNGTLAGSLTAGTSLSTGSAQMGANSGTAQPGSIQFRTSTGVISDDEEVYWGDVQNVSYYLSQSSSSDDTSGKELMRAVTRNLLAVNTNDLTELPLLDGVKTLEYQFYDGTQWTNAWDSTVASPALPQAIKLVITMEPDEDQNQNQIQLQTPFEITVPVLVQTRSNVTASASGGGS
jgi:hypothetical protein